jgi:putative tricarboxylic transport membrane protein
MSAPPQVPATERQTRPARGGARSQVHRIAPLLLLALGVAAFLMARAMGFGEFTTPGPGLWPAIVAGLLIATAAVLVVVDPAEDYEPWTSGTLRIVVGLVGLGLFVLLFDLIGFVIPAFLLLTAWLRYFGEESWRMAVGLGAAGAVVLHLVFVVALGVPFPSGPVDQLLGG